MSTSLAQTERSPETNYTVSQVASALDVTPATVRLWLREGELIGFKINSRDWRISETELKNFIHKRHGA